MENDAVIVGADDFSADAFRLLELNADVERAILAGHRIVIVGQPDARAVLCTPDKSFFLAKEDTSNLRLLTTHTEWKRDDAAQRPVEIQVRGSAQSHFVLQPKTPDIAQLRALLLRSPLEGASSEASPPPTKRAKTDKDAEPALYSTDDLVVALQTSEHEVLELLKELHAFQDDDGFWRVLSPAYETCLFRGMLDAIVENDWLALTTPGVSISQFQAGALASEPLVAIRQCCFTYGQVTGKGKDEKCVLDATKVAVFCATGLFEERAAERRLAQQHTQFQTASLPMASAGGFDNAEGDQGWDLAQFMDKWQLRVPTGVTVHSDMLRGLVLKRKKGIVFFPEHALPTDPKKRFDALFAAQDKWTVHELEPFIKSLIRPGVTQAALLLRYARSSRQANSTERLYSKR